jgi:hypothetical protein
MTKLKKVGTVLTLELLCADRHRVNLLSAFAVDLKDWLFRQRSSTAATEFQRFFQVLCIMEYNLLNEGGDKSSIVLIVPRYASLSSSARGSHRNGSMKWVGNRQKVGPGP